MTDIQFITAEVCPFAQRSLIALLEKNIAHEHIEIDLRAKPDWFEQVSPYSKVPVLRHGEIRVYESAIINEYLEEVFPEPALMPADAAGRARVRVWIDFDNVKFVPAFYKVLLTDDTARRAELSQSITDALRFIETEALATGAGGPYWLGETLSLADVAVYPHMERLAVLEAYRGIAVPAECGRLKEWLGAMGERASVRKTAHDADYHIKAYANYADGTANGTTAKDMRL
jgi:glutathione S-transferase